MFFLVDSGVVEVVKKNSVTGNLHHYLYSFYLLIFFVLAGSGVFTINLLSNFQSQQAEYFFYSEKDHYVLLQSVDIVDGTTFNDLLKLIKERLPSQLGNVYTEIMIADVATITLFEPSRWNEVLTQQLFVVNTNMYLEFEGIYFHYKHLILCFLYIYNFCSSAVKTYIFGPF